MADRATTARKTRNTVSRSPAQSPILENQPKRSQRVTRSQSRDISDSDVERKSIYQKGAKGTERTGVDGSAAGSKQRRGKPIRNNDPAILQVLPEVDENAPVTYPHSPHKSPEIVEQAQTSIIANRRRSHQPPRSPGGASTFSGTTARISGSVRRLSGSRPEDMMDALEDLSKASKKILDPLIPAQVTEASIQRLKEHLSEMKSKEARQLQRNTPDFQAQREVYGGERFVNAPDIVRVILGASKLDDVHLGPWRMDPVLYQANLASLITALIAHGGEDAESVQSELVKSFPRPFLERFVPITKVEGAADASALLWETLRLGIEIRTRSFIDSAKQFVNEPGFDPDELLTQVFYRNGRKLRGWNVAGLRSEDIDGNKDFKTLIINRLDQLRETFSEIEEPIIDFEVLENAFSHARVTTAVVRWIQLRLREIQNQLQSVKGVAGIVQAIKSAKGDDRLSLGAIDGDLPRGNNAHGVVLNYERPSDSPQPNSKRTPPARLKNPALESVASKPYTFGSPEARPRATARLKQREAGKRLSRAPAQSASPAKTAASEPQLTKSTNEAESGTPPSGQLPAEEDDQSLILDPVDRTADAEEILHVYSTLEAENNKENRPIPPQPQLTEKSMPREGHSKKRGMIHPTFDAQPQPTAQSPSSSSQESEPRPAKKSRPPANNLPRTNIHALEDASSSDEDFQEDTRAVTQPRRPKPSPKASRSGADSQRSARRPQEAPQNRDTGGFNDLEDVLGIHNSANAPAPSQIDNYRRVNALAKRQTAMRPKRVQTRTPWSQEETERLLDLIAEHGLSWSLLKKMDRNHPNGQLFQTRDQVALKDKARNIKADYLR
ncbi:MAG: hypothetical protein Q9184_003048 [Pyrenodesmia sp. 2 TL-2023]